MIPRYEITLYWSEIDSAFVAEVADLPGCMAHGSTYEEALARAHEAIAAWIDTAVEDGASIPSPRTRAAEPR